MRRYKHGYRVKRSEILKIIKKGETIEQIERIRAAKIYFNKVNGYFIIDLPGSSYEKDLASVNWS